MAGTIYHDSNLDVLGNIKVSTVPNSTGSIVTWNSTTNVLGLRTNAQIISDLGLQGGLTNGLHTILNGNKVDVAFDVNTYVKDKSNNNRLLFGNTMQTDVVIKGAVANGDFKVKDSTDADLFRISGTNKVAYFPQLPAPQTGDSNLAIIDSGNGLWKHSTKISDLVTTNALNPLLNGKANVNGNNLTNIADWRNNLGVYSTTQVDNFLANKITGSSSPSSPQNFNFAIGFDGSRNFIQSHSGLPLELNPLGNDVKIYGYDVWTFGNFNPNTKANVNGNNLTNIQTWRDNLGIGVLNNLSTTHKTTIVGAINEVNQKQSDVKIGGRNYVLGSDKYLTDPFQEALLFNSTELQNWRGKTVNVSADIELANATGSRIGFEVSIVFQNGTIMDVGTWHNISQGANFKGRISTTHDIPDLPISHLHYVGIYIQCNGTTTTVGRPKLEFGNKATDWTPAIEDQIPDWNETDSTKYSFIKNKPTIPNAANNGLLTLATGTGLTGGATFSADQATAANFTVGIASTHVLPTTAQVATWNAKGNGTVTSVAMTAPTGLTVTGSPITSTGTLVLGYASGYQGYTTTEANKLAGLSNYVLPTASATVLGGIKVGSNLSIDANGVLSATNTNTTYTAGNGLTLTGTVFSLPVTQAGTGNAVTDVTQTANGITVTKGATFLTSFTETDPIFTASPAFGITSGDITNWNGKQNALVAGSNITINPTTNVISATDTNTVTRLRGTASGTYTSGDLTLLAGANVSIVQSGSNFTINATDTNTTYTAGTGLSLTGTTFGQTITTSGTGTFVTGVTQTANGFQVNLGTPPNTTYTGSNGINVTGTVISPTYGTTANTIAQGNDARINNGQTAFSWGNHAGLYPLLNGSYANPTWISSLDWSKITNAPTIPTVGNGQLSFTAPIGLNISGTFNANQSGNTTIPIAWQAGYQGYTATEANKLAGIQAGATVPNNGTFTVQGTGALTGSGSTSADASANTSVTLDLTTATKNDITAGKNAGIQVTSLFSDAVEYFRYHDMSGGGFVDTNDAFFNLVNPKTVSGLVIDIINHHVRGARLVLQGVTGMGGIVTYTGKFIMRNHTLLGTLVIEGQIDQEFVWDVNVSRWREVF